MGIGEDIVINLIYASSASEMLNEDELLALLEKAREKNTRLGITGMLLYRGGNFLQVLEGEANIVRDLYNVIKKDPRHKGVISIAERQVEERNFTEWSMAFVNLQKIDPQSVPGYSEFLSEDFSGEHFRANPTLAHRFLRVFKEGMR